MTIPTRRETNQGGDYILLESWPESTVGEEYQEALQACIADLKGIPNTARESFIKAALAAGLSARPNQLH